jgi:hypothetical protein
MAFLNVEEHCFEVILKQFQSAVANEVKACRAEYLMVISTFPINALAERSL